MWSSEPGLGIMARGNTEPRDVTMVGRGSSSSGMGDGDSEICLLRSVASLGEAFGKRFITGGVDRRASIANARDRSLVGGEHPRGGDFGYLSHVGKPPLIELCTDR